MTMGLIAVVGPTGTGKSNLAVNLAIRLAALGVKSEIVNADAMQLYRGMDIGTAKLTPPEQQGFPHHLINVLEVREESTAAEYQKSARAIILDLQSREILPILVGGSMLYIASVLNNFDFPERDESLRAQLEEELLATGARAMHEKLKAMDPQAASRIIPENGRRTVRAIEIVTLTGKPFAAALPETVSSWQPVLEIGLTLDRPKLLPILEGRVRSMWENGIVSEAESLIPMGIREAKTARVAIGYSQALAQLDGELTQPEAIELTTRLTQRYARRQMSWFRRDNRINWLETLEPDLAARAIALIQNSGILEERT